MADILDPGAAVDPRRQETAVTLRDGRTLAGVREPGGDMGSPVVLRLPGGRREAFAGEAGPLTTSSDESAAAARAARSCESSSSTAATCAAVIPSPASRRRPSAAAVTAVGATRDDMPSPE